MTITDKGDMSLGGAVPGHAERQSPVAAQGFTPGPWLASNRTWRTHNSPDRFWERNIHTASELLTVGTAHGANAQEAEANASLIAAAPEMFDALKNAAAFIEAPDVQDEVWALIARIEGQQ